MSVIGKQTQSRGVWALNPVTRIKDSKKKYKRSESKKDTLRRIDEHAKN